MLYLMRDRLVISHAIAKVPGQQILLLTSWSTGKKLVLSKRALPPLWQESCTVSNPASVREPQSIDDGTLYECRCQDR